MNTDVIAGDARQVRSTMHRSSISIGDGSRAQTTISESGARDSLKNPVLASGDETQSR
jgi:hypothetical protein